MPLHLCSCSLVLSGSRSIAWPAWFSDVLLFLRFLCAIKWLLLLCTCVKMLCDAVLFDVPVQSWCSLCVVYLFEGDALGIYPENCGDNVDEILKLTGWQDSQLVDIPAHAYQPIDGNTSDFCFIWHCWLGYVTYEWLKKNFYTSFDIYFSSSYKLLAWWSNDVQ